MARHARQHQTTRIEWAVYGPEHDAKDYAARFRGVAKQARLLGEVVWCAKVGEITTVFMFPDTGRKLGLCMYRWCTRKRSECGYHTGRPM
jgi:hypothetical protein